MIKRVWAKFDDMDLVCVCDEHHRKCTDNKSCKEYVVKFMEIDRNTEVEDAMEHLAKETDNVRREVKRFESEVSKSIRKMKKFRI